MKVVYDISRLGEGYNNTRYQTGINRVVENVAYGLLSSLKCSLSFCASESLEMSNQARDYLKHNPKFQKTPFSHSKVGYEIYKILNNLKHETDTSSKSRKFQTKLLNLISSRLVEPYYSQLLCPNLLSKPDIFHSPFYAIPEHLKSNKRVKKFLTVYDITPVVYPHFFEANVDKWFRKILYSLDYDSWVICISYSTKNDLCNCLKIDPSKVFVTHLAASKCFYQDSDRNKIAATRNKYNIPNTPYILSLNTLEPRKNIAHLIQCFRKLVHQEKINDLCLVLAGGKGWLYNQLFEEISSCEALKNRVIVTGYVADEDLATLYSGALAFVYTSFYEGFGLPPLEAMQCGVPVITSNTSSLPEVVGDAGIMVAPTDADMLCDSMLALYTKSSLREAMSLKSLERAKLFSWEKCTQETLASYRFALNS